MAVTPLHRRRHWSADRGPRCESHNIDPEGITAHYTGPSDWRQAGVDRSSPARFEATTDHRRCAPLVRSHRDFHMDGRGWCFLAYNEVVCPHGHRYESRPPGTRSGAQGTNDGNQRSYAVLYLAGAHDPLTDAAKRAFLDTPARFAVALRWGHREWKPTACPETPPPPALWAWRLAGFPAPPPEEDDFMPELSPKEQRKLYNDAGAAVFLGHATLDVARKGLRAAQTRDAHEGMTDIAALRREWGAKDGETLEDAFDRYGRELVEMFRAAEATDSG